MGGFENMFNEVSDSIIKLIKGDVKEKAVPPVPPVVKVEKVNEIGHVDRTAAPEKSGLTAIQAQIVNKINTVIHPNERADIIAACNHIIEDLTENKVEGK